MEKLTLALVHAARRLRRYFQAHSIKVITDSPIKQVLSNSESSGRLAKWVVEQGAYGIQYVPRVAVKGQVLADFLADTSIEINVALVERIYQKSQENSQKQASTNMRIRRVQKEAKESKPKPEMSSLSQKQSKDGQQKSTRPTIFHLNPQSFTKV
ncbi:reverse transcriptase domain-containing protein [Tanacetum coccineum]